MYTYIFLASRVPRDLETEPKKNSLINPAPIYINKYRHFGMREGDRLRGSADRQFPVNLLQRLSPIKIAHHNEHLVARSHLLIPIFS